MLKIAIDVDILHDIIEGRMRGRLQEVEKECTCSAT